MHGNLCIVYVHAAKYPKSRHIWLQLLSAVAIVDSTFNVLLTLQRHVFPGEDQACLTVTGVCIEANSTNLAGAWQSYICGIPYSLRLLTGPGFDTRRGGPESKIGQTLAV